MWNTSPNINGGKSLYVGFTDDSENVRIILPSKNMMAKIASKIYLVKLISGSSSEGASISTYSMIVVF